MTLTMSTADLARYTRTQVEHLFPAKGAWDARRFRRDVGKALDRVEHCFRHIAHPSYSDAAGARFDPFQSDQYCQYLYFLSRTVHEESQDRRLAGRLFALNKALHAFNCMYDTVLPDIFWVIHAVGTVLGKASYSDYLVVRQNCTVGAIRGEYPVMGEGLILSAGASVIGACRIGRNVMVGPGCQVVNQDLPDDTFVASAPTLKRRKNGPRPFEAHFHPR